MWSGDGKNGMTWMGRLRALRFEGDGSGLTNVRVGAGGNNHSIQFNDGGNLNGEDSFTFDGNDVVLEDGKITIIRDVSDYTDEDSAHIIIKNDDLVGQSGIWFDFSDTPMSKIRADYAGNMNFGAIGCFVWYAGALDYSDGTTIHTKTMEHCDNLDNPYTYVYDQSGNYIGIGLNAGAPYVNMNGNLGYTGELRDSQSNKIADVIGGIITAVTY